MEDQPIILFPMETHTTQKNAAPQKAVPAKISLWQKIGAGSLSISVLLHLVLLAVAVIWVLQIIPPAEEKAIDFLGKSGGGGSPVSESKASKQRLPMMSPSTARVSAMNSVGSIVLPEPESLSAMTSLGSISPGGLAGGLGGAGSGGGRGLGKGLGIGDGLTPGFSSGNASKNPFGMLDMTPDALVGTFYDFKQTNKRKPTNLTDDEMRQELRKIVKQGFGERSFRDYYKAEAQLYQTKLRIPTMSAYVAPAAFGVEKEVQPRQWAVVYRGAVKAPKSGKFRFVGAADDVLVVKFNNKLVFDHGYTLATSAGSGGLMSQENYKTNEDSDAGKDFKRYSPMPVPTLTYKYAATGALNKALKGLAVGPEFEVTEGSIYPIEILISEVPGGFFSAALLIEEKGVTYEKDPAGSPILPLFRLDNSPPDTSTNGQAPPFDPNGPVWRSVQGAAKREI